MSLPKEKDTHRVTFTAPHGSETFVADITATTTGEEALGGLLAEKFIESPPKDQAYVLTLDRTRKMLPVSQPLIASGVRDGDTVAVTQPRTGARA